MRLCVCVCILDSKNFPIPSCDLSLTTYFVADGISPDGSNILLVHNRCCVREGAGGNGEWSGEERGIDDGFREKRREAVE